MNQSYPGRAKYRSNVEGPTGKLLVAVLCRVGTRPDRETALIDTASQWRVLPPSIAHELGYALDWEGDTLLHTRFGRLSGELVRIPVIFPADEGEPHPEGTRVEATWFLSPGWPGPMRVPARSVGAAGAGVWNRVPWAAASPLTRGRAISTSRSTERPVTE